MMINSSLFSILKQLFSLFTLFAGNQSQLLFWEIEKERGFMIKLLLAVGCCLLFLFFTFISLLLLLFLLVDPQHRVLFFALTTASFFIISVILIVVTLYKAKNYTFLPIIRSRFSSLRRLDQKRQ